MLVSKSCFAKTSLCLSLPQNRKRMSGSACIWTWVLPSVLNAVHAKDWMARVYACNNLMLNDAKKNDYFVCRKSVLAWACRHGNLQFSSILFQTLSNVVFSFFLSSSRVSVSGVAIEDTHAKRGGSLGVYVHQRCFLLGRRTARCNINSRCLSFLVSASSSEVMARYARQARNRTQLVDPFFF